MSVERCTKDLSTLLARMNAHTSRSIALDLLFDEVETEMEAGHAPAVDEWLTGIDPATLPPEITVAIMTATLVWRDELYARPAFCQRALAALAVQVGQERAEHLCFGRR
jgi:hypothetical protein